MVTEKAGYVVQYFSHLMTEQERRAHLHLAATLKATGRPYIPSQTEARGSHPLMSNDPEVLSLLSEGGDAFIERTAQRILHEHPDKVAFNSCPQCGGLARTPRARQCRFCGFDWHDSST